MATNKPISTISYNTEAFLVDVLNSWYKQHLIQAWMYIKHKGEDGDKDHYHVRIEPNKRIDPMDLTSDLIEPDPRHEKPLGCRPWRPSKEEDWFLYAIHDKEYLRIKYSESKDGKLPYTIDNIVVSDGYDKEVALLRARQSLDNHTACIVKELREGRRVVDLIENGRDVFRTKAVLQTLTMTEYETICSKYNDLQKQIRQIDELLIKSGLRLNFVDGKPELQLISIDKLYKYTRLKK